MRIRDWSSDVCSSDLPWKRDAARAMDRGIDWIVGAPDYPEFEEPAVDRAAAWPKVVEALRTGEEANRFRYAHQRTQLLSATRVGELDRPGALLTTLRCRHIPCTVRHQRYRTAVVTPPVMHCTMPLDA